MREGRAAEHSPKELSSQELSTKVTAEVLKVAERIKEGTTLGEPEQELMEQLAPKVHKIIMDSGENKELLEKISSQATTEIMKVVQMIEDGKTTDPETHVNMLASKISDIILK